MVLDTITSSLFRTLSRVRAARVFHPRGAAYDGVWEPARAGRLPSGTLGTDQLRAIVRFSRGLGLDPPFPDILGVAVKVLDAHGRGHDQDFLLASVGRGRFGTRVLLPRTRFSSSTFSTVLPYDIAGARTAVVAVVDGEPATGTDEAADPTDVRVRLSLARSGMALATVQVGRPLSAPVARDLRFDPWHTGEAITPIGLLNRLRRPAYEASQRGRGAPAGGARSELLERERGGAPADHEDPTE